MAAIFQTTFSDAFSWIENSCNLIQISLKFVPKGSIENVIIGSGNGLALNRWQAIIWTDDG